MYEDQPESQASGQSMTSQRRQELKEAATSEKLPEDSQKAQDLTKLFYGAEVAKKEGDLDKFNEINNFLTSWYKSGDLVIEELPNHNAIDVLGEKLGLDIFDKTKNIVQTTLVGTRPDIRGPHITKRTDDLIDYNNPIVKQAFSSYLKRVGMEPRFATSRAETPTSERPAVKRQTQTNPVTGQSGKSLLGRIFKR